MSRIKVMLDSGAHSLYNLYRSKEYKDSGGLASKIKATLDSLEEGAKFTSDDFARLVKGYPREKIKLAFYGISSGDRFNRLVEVVGRKKCRDGSNRVVYRRSFSSNITHNNFYNTREFDNYVERYMRFLSAYEDSIDVSVGMDIINNPKASYRVYCMMSDLGYDVMPTLHGGADKKWLYKYLDRTDYIGLGGIGIDVKHSSMRNYFDSLFKLISNKKTGAPTVKFHGFAVTSSAYLKRYPWYSVDSSSWTKVAGYGQVVVPTFDSSGYNYLNFKKIKVSDRSLLGVGGIGACHLGAMPKCISDLLRGYFEFVLGSELLDKDRVEDSNLLRQILNIFIYIILSEKINDHYKKFFNYSKGGRLYISYSGITPLMLSKINDWYSQGLFSESSKINFITSYFFRTDAKHLMALKRRFETIDTGKVKRNRIVVTRRRLLV